MKRSFCFPIILSVCAAGCLVETGCAAIGKLADETATVLFGGGVQETPDPETSTTKDETTETEPAVVTDIIPESVPTWLAALLLVLGRALPSKGVVPTSKSLAAWIKKILGG